MYLNDSEPELNIIIFLPHVITVSILFYGYPLYGYLLMMFGLFPISGYFK